MTFQLDWYIIILFQKHCHCSLRENLLKDGGSAQVVLTWLDESSIHLLVLS